MTLLKHLALKQASMGCFQEKGTKWQRYIGKKTHNNLYWVVVIDKFTEVGCKWARRQDNDFGFNSTH